MHVTAVVAVRNGEPFLGEALASIAAQTRPPAEILVVDGRSSDGTVEIARALGARVVTQQGTGIADAYNTAIREAQGEVIAFLSHDDRWHPDKLAVQVSWLLDHPDMDAVVCQVRHFLDDRDHVPGGFRRALLDTEPVAFIMETLAARRRAFEKAGLFDIRLRISEDVDWFSRARDLGVRIGAVPRTLVEKRVHVTNASLQQPDHRDLLDAVRASVARKRGSQRDS